MPPFQLIGFDADDTLWETERLYVRAQASLRTMLARYVDEAAIDGRLYQTEMRNLEQFGYGIKAFALSMIETAIELTDGRVTAPEIQQIVHTAREMLIADIQLIEHVPDVLAALAASHSLMLITKGDLRDQEDKIVRSGVAVHFRFVEIVSDKSRDIYQAILEKHAVRSEHFLMVGNSVRSDILPVLELGGQAVLIPHELTWAHEAAEAPPSGQPGFHTLEHIDQLPELIADLEAQPASRS